jgi:flagellar hook-length control protein FliK
LRWLARSLLIGGQGFIARVPVVSVTSEVSASLSFQAASARSSRPDSSPSAGNDSFAALVDINTAGASSDNRPQDTSSAQGAPPRRADDPPPTADTRSRDNSAPDKTARNDADGRDTTTGQRDDADADNADTARRTESKSAASKSDDKKLTSDDTKSTSKSSSEDNASANKQAEPKQDGAIATTANAVAVAISAAAALADVPAATTPGSDKATTPLAIAAAAIAATSSISAPDSAATPATASTDPTPAATPTVAAAKVAGTKIDAHAAISQTASTQATAPDATAPTGLALAASVAGATPASTKSGTALKPALVAKDGITKTTEQSNTIGTADASTTATPTANVQGPTQPIAVADKVKTENGVIDAVKTDAAGNSALTSAANGGANGRASADAAQTLANSTDGAQAAGAIQPQLPSTSAAPPAPAPQFTVTAATQAAVPLSGLALEIATSAKSGKSRFEIRLDPADLGRIDVRIDVDRNGQVTSHLTVEKPETLSMLRQDAPQLQRALDDAGFKTGGGGLQFSLRDQSSSGQNSGNDTGRNAQRLVISNEDTIPAATIAGRTYGRMLGSSSGVDIRV